MTVSVSQAGSVQTVNFLSMIVWVSVAVSSIEMNINKNITMIYLVFIRYCVVVSKQESFYIGKWLKRLCSSSSITSKNF